MRDCKHCQLARSCQICDLESERDRLCELSNSYVKEIAGLKVGLGIVRCPHGDGGYCQKDINSLKSRVEKLAEVLKDAFNYSRRESWEKKAKEVLSDFEKENS